MTNLPPFLIKCIHLLSNHTGSTTTKLIFCYILRYHKYRLKRREHCHIKNNLFVSFCNKNMSARGIIQHQQNLINFVHVLETEVALLYCYIILSSTEKTAGTYKFFFSEKYQFVKQSVYGLFTAVVCFFLCHTGQYLLFRATILTRYKPGLFNRSS